VVADERVGGGAALADGNQSQTFREGHGDVFHGVHGEVGAAVEHGFLEFLYEQGFAADLGQWHVQDFVALGLDFDQLNGDAAVESFQFSFNEFCLPQRQGAAAGCNAKSSCRHGTHCRWEKCFPWLPCDFEKVPLCGGSITLGGEPAGRLLLQPLANLGSMAPADRQRCVRVFQ
jgi:hypothetical protein